MANIHLLKDELINKIAAGEVVERPSSVAKELIENALDAGAKNIVLSLKEGGTKLISVRDDGQGIDPQDGPLVLSRHATSKISASDDLFAIDTMGFRGEALAAISSVSRFSLRSQREGCDGFMIEANDEEQRILPWQGAQGTTVSVEDLFHCVPVRRKFMKKPSTEYSQCLELVEALSINLPEVGFAVEHNGKETFRVAPLPEYTHEYLRGEDNFRRRVEKVLGKQVGEQLIYFEETFEFGMVEALISPPGLERHNSKGILTYVNNRWVKDKTLRYGVMRGYHSHLLKGRYPIVILCLTIDPSLVDVNVHPAKVELRFQYASEIQKMIAGSIKTHIRQGAWVAPTLEDPIADLPSKQPTKDFDLVSRGPAPVSRPLGRKDVPKDFDLGLPFAAPTPRPSVEAGGGGRYQEKPARDMTVTRKVESFGASTKASYEPPILPESVSEKPSPSEGRIPWEECRLIGSFAACYLLFEHGDQLLAVDQHAFHERIIYERLMRDYNNLGGGQGLLVPESVELDSSSIEVLKDHEEVLGELGFKFDFVDMKVVELLSIPSLLGKSDPENLLRELVEDLRNNPLDIKALDSAHHLLSTMACHSAVRAGEILEAENVKDLLREAKDVDFYHNCPHGRRVFRYFSKSQVGRWFDR